MRKYFFVFMALISGLILNGFLITTASATDDAIIQIAPISQKIELNPGDTYTGTFSVQNVGGKPLDYQITAVPYQVTDANYSPDFVTKSNRTKIVDWISFDIMKNNLSPGFYDTVKYTIKVPKDAPAGGQYASIMAYKTVSDQDESSLKIARRVGMLLYATVSGDTREEGQIVANNVSSVVFKPPFSTWTELNNTGNVDSEAHISLKISNFFTDRVLYDNTDIPSSVIVLPETKRVQTSSWEDAPKFGLFKVTQTVQFIGQTSVNEKVVLACPLWIIIMTITIIALAIILLVYKISHNKTKFDSCTI